MNDSLAKQQQCPICGKSKSKVKFSRTDFIRPGILRLIHTDHPDWNPKQGTCTAEQGKKTA